jgi:hypothetical protein
MDGVSTSRRKGIGGKGAANEYGLPRNFFSFIKPRIEWIGTGFIGLNLVGVGSVVLSVN